jgi:hypothetical protein
MPIATADGDLGMDSAEFDRTAFLKQLAADVPALLGPAFACDLVFHRC